MIGKITVSTPNPPCVSCGGMGGYHGPKCTRTPPELDRITDAVLAYKPKPKTKAAKRRKRKRNRDAKKV